MNLYQTQIAHSAFLLGYSYFEAFLFDLSKEIFKKRPALLPGNKQLKFSEILDLKNYNSIVTNMIGKHVISILYNSLESVAEYYRDKLNIAWPANDKKASFVEGSLIRNCIMHNGSVVDSRLAKISKWEEGEMIELLPDDVHDYGLELRSLAHTIHEEAVIKHLKNGTE